MNDIVDALTTSRQLDDRRSAGEAGSVPTGHARVHRALSDHGATPWLEAPSALRERILARTTAPPREPGFARHALFGALAAAVVLGAGIAVIVMTSPATPPATGAPPRIAQDAPGPAALVRLPSSVAPITESVPAPLLEEAENIRVDTRRAVAAVFGRLPGGWTR
ncbi:MAG: hypothetical protein SFY69_12720 [Planctomycetota bacterium]|nr:hypothetical protein [Planctomycetota bacterium]